MITFSIFATLLMAGALLFILPTLLRKGAVANPHALRDEVNLMVLRDQLSELDADLAAGTIDATGYESARRELERRVAEDVQPSTANVESGTSKRWTAMVLGLTLPLVAISLYVLLGAPDGLEPARVAAPEVAENNATERPSDEQVLQMIDKLAQRMKTQPDDAKGWAILARSYIKLNKFAEAADAYSHLVKLAPNDADLLTDYADALAMSQNKSLQGEPTKLIQRALEVDPQNLKALALSGSAAFERKDYPTAIAQWKKILPMVAPESETTKAIISSIAEANALAGKKVAGSDSVEKAPAAPTASASAASKVSGTVELDAALRAKVSDTDTVFIFARAAQGPRFPLAVLRKQVKDLPTSFVLDDSMSMVPDAKLSGFPMVVVGARISKSDNATPSAGDLEGLSEPVKPGATGLKIRINSERK